MSLSIEQVLADAKKLVERLRDHDNAAEGLIGQTSTLNKKVEAMKQYQEEIEDMNNVARHRPRSALILGIQQENRQIRDLQRENRELRVALEEHQSALDLIMSSYREQVCKLVMANNMDKECQNVGGNQTATKAATEKIVEMAVVMQRAIEMDEESAFEVDEALTRLQVENSGLRELLNISTKTHNRHRAIIVEKSPITDLDEEKMDETSEKDELSSNKSEDKNQNCADDKSPESDTHVDEENNSNNNNAPSTTTITGASSPTSIDNELSKIEMIAQDGNKLADENGSSVDSRGTSSS